MAKYRINYNKVIGQANDIKGLSDDLRDEIQRMERHLETIKKEWKGPASETYQKQLKCLISKMESARSKMTSLSSTIKTVARSIQQEDQELAEKAKNNASFGGGGSSGGGGCSRSF